MTPTIDPSNPDASNPHVDLASAFGETLLDELRERGGARRKLSPPRAVVPNKWSTPS